MSATFGHITRRLKPVQTEAERLAARLAEVEGPLVTRITGNSRNCPPIQTAARIIAESRGDWLFDPDFDGWSVKQ